MLRCHIGSIRAVSIFILSQASSADSMPSEFWACTKCEKFVFQAECPSCGSAAKSIPDWIEFLQAKKKNKPKLPKGTVGKVLEPKVLKASEPKLPKGTVGKSCLRYRR